MHLPLEIQNPLPEHRHSDFNGNPRTRTASPHLLHLVTTLCVSQLAHYMDGFAHAVLDFDKKELGPHPLLLVM